MMSDWIKHDGGARPVPPETPVRLRFKGETEATAAMSLVDAAGRYSWRNRSGKPAIIAYQVADAP